MPNLIPIETKKLNTCQEIIDEVSKLPFNDSAKELTKKRDLDILNVTWEDTGRNQNSSVGPNISDMTLAVNDQAMPVIRYPNFADLSWDLKMEEIPLTIGNQASNNSENFQTVGLDKYLKNISEYTGLPEGTNLYCEERDSHVLVSSQACLLPVVSNPERSEGDDKKVEPTKFYVRIYNYQSSSDDPAVLYILATSNGTSPQLPEKDGYDPQKLYHNDKGTKRSLTAQRLTQDRIERGVEDLSAPMTEQESKENMVVVIQVPLKRRTPPARPKYSFGGFGSSLPPGVMACCPAPMMLNSSRMADTSMVVDVEDAIVKLGSEDYGKFDNLEDKKIERDTRFPVRVTLQFYKATSNGSLNKEVVDKIADAMHEARIKGDCWGSLVVDPADWIEKRPTAPKVN